MPNHFHWMIEVEDVGNSRDCSLQKKGLSSIIWAFKTTSSKLIHKSWLQSFKRQKSFYDHVIRNENDMNRIIEYIELNPYARENDEHYR
jgi:REP element-mobilizing transposase RayT